MAQQEQMIQLIIVRAKELIKNVEVRKIMCGFNSNEEANDWLIKASIATLMGVQHSK